MSGGLLDDCTEVVKRASGSEIRKYNSALIGAILGGSIALIVIFPLLGILIYFLPFVIAAFFVAIILGGVLGSQFHFSLKSLLLPLGLFLLGLGFFSVYPIISLWYLKYEFHHLPQYPRSELLSEQVLRQTDGGYTHVVGIAGYYNTDDSIEDVRKFYAQILSAKGWYNQSSDPINASYWVYDGGRQTNYPRHQKSFGISTVIDKTIDRYSYTLLFSN